MSLFSKKGKGDTIDFTYLQKRGLLRPPRHTYKVGLPRTGDGMVDLRGTVNQSESASSTQSNSSDTSNAFGFLANLAGTQPTPSDGTSTTTSSEVSIPSPFSSGDQSQDDRIREARRARLAEFNAMKVKIDDLEYKLERSLERIAQLENQLAEIKR